MARFLHVSWVGAVGILRAAVAGRPGQRYILGGEDFSIRQLMVHLQASFGTSAPRARLPLAIVRAIAGLAETWGGMRGHRARLNRMFG
ncbi:MAG: hypothetical protein KAY32_04085 [Candidatus Eisenbacteria sp.]|nr:hypothetical protein [Candidatus Eisenbacteria bacterium]